jgi:hypothetical protein
MESALDDGFSSPTGILPEPAPIKQPPIDLGSTGSIAGRISDLDQDRIGLENGIADLGRADISDAEGIVKERQESNQRIRDLGPWPHLKVPEFKTEEYAMSSQARAAAGILAAVALIGSAKMKTGAVGAMDALTATIIGFHTGHQAMYERGRQEYKENLDRVIAEQKDMLAERQAIIADEKMNTQEKIDAYNLSMMKRGVARKDMARSLTQIVSETNSLLRAGIALAKEQEKPAPGPKDTRTPQQKNYEYIAKQGATASGKSIREWMSEPGNSFQEKLKAGELGAASGKGDGERSFYANDGAAAGPKTRAEAIKTYTEAKTNKGASAQQIEDAVTRDFPNLK